MQQLGQYVVSLTAAALICGILLSLFPEGTVRSLLRLCCGVFLTVTALSPLPGIQLPENFSLSERYFREGQAIASQGERMAMDAREQGIKQALEAYILDKAANLGTAVQPEVTLGTNGSPTGVALRGCWEESAKGTLKAIITNDLGIPEEDQQWMREKQWLESENSGGNTGGPP